MRPWIVLATLMAATQISSRRCTAAGELKQAVAGNLALNPASEPDEAPFASFPG
jgi:hypothetical protein